MNVKKRMSRADDFFPWLRRVIACLIATAVLLVPSISLAQKPAAAAGNSDDEVVVDAATESVIKGGLRYLAAKQSPTAATSHSSRCWAS